MSKHTLKKSLVILSIIILSALLFSACGFNYRELESASINDNGELILTFSNGEEQNLGVVKGENGATGQPGKNGADGQNGQNGEDGTISVVGNDSTVSLAASKGLQSAVSIECGFTKSVQNSIGGYRPGYGGSTTSSYTSAGSGVIYELDKATGDAFIITNYHVVYDVSSNSTDGISEDITVYLYGAESAEQGIKAEYVGGSLYYDIAVLHVSGSEALKGSDHCAVTVADSDLISVGDTAIAVGNPENMGISVSNGIISVDSEYITMTAADESTTVSFRVMRVDTAVNSGNSGGGLYDSTGALAGIVNAKISSSDVENIAYAIPSNIAAAVANNIIDNCFGKDIKTVQRGILGITLNVTDSHAVYNTSTGHISIEETVSVYEVSDGSLADGSILAGDTIVSATLNGRTVQVTRQYHIIDLMLSVRVGDTVKLTVLRDGAQHTYDLTFTEDHIISY